MKTLTEFSALVLRNAAAARAAAGGARPEPRAEAPVVEPPAITEAEPTGEPSAPVEASAEPVEASEAPEAAEAAAEPAKAETDPIVIAVAAALSVQPDRAARLLEALDIVGGSIDHVRLVRVYQGEKGPHNAISRGEFHYVIDRVAGAQRSAPRDDRRGDRGGRGGGDRGGSGGPPGRGGFGGDRKPRGLGSLKIGAAKDEPRDERVGRGEMPHAGIGWQLTAAPRDFGGGKGRGGPGGPRGPGRGRGPGGPGGPRSDRPGGGGRGPGPGGERRGNGPGPGGGPRPYEGRNPRNHGAARPPIVEHAPIVEHVTTPPAPQLGPDGQPLPPRVKRPRKPIGPDANGMGPDGTPWDPERRGKRAVERQPAAVNAEPTAAVETQPPAHGDSSE